MNYLCKPDPVIMVIKTYIYSKRINETELED